MNRGYLLTRVSLLQALAAALVSWQSASAELLTSFENTTDGWTINTTENGPYSFTGYSTTQGVTDGDYSAIVTGTAAPSYGQLLVSPTSSALTGLLSTTEEVSIDVTTDPGAFGFGTQWTAVINNNELGYVSLDGFGYTGFVGPGGSGTLSWSVSAGQRATLAGSPSDSTLIFQVGGGDAGVMYVDNIRLATVPEPACIALAFAVAILPLMRRR